MVPFLPHPGVVDAIVVRGAAAPPLSTPDLLIEIPHGATGKISKKDLRDQFRSAPVPPHS
jgi:hypothetical protein